MPLATALKELQALFEDGRMGFLSFLHPRRRAVGLVEKLRTSEGYELDKAYVKLVEAVASSPGERAAAYAAGLFTVLELHYHSGSHALRQLLILKTIIAYEGDESRRQQLAVRHKFLQVYQ